MARSGHSCDIFENYMIIFGGIYEITRELNDFYLYDLKQNKWVTLFEESGSPSKIREMSPSMIHEDVSPTFAGGSSPNKKSNQSPNGRLGNTKTGSPPKSSSKMIKPSTQ